MILRRSPNALTLVTYDGYVSPALGIPVPWRVLCHEGPENWSPGGHLDDDDVQGWVYLSDRPAVRDAREEAVELRRVASERAAQILHLKKELKRAGKAYGRASAAIGELRRDLALARLYRTCWAKAKASDCSACRAVFADTAPHEVTAEQAAAVAAMIKDGTMPRRKLPRSLGMGKNGPADLSEREPGVVCSMTMEHFGPVNDSDATSEAFEAALTGPHRIGSGACNWGCCSDSTLKPRTCAATFTGSGRDTGHSLCGSPEGPITLHGENVTCFDCVQLLTNGGDED